MLVFSLAVTAREAISRLFQAHESGGLVLGPAGASLDPVAPEALLDGPVLFRDYVLEGFVGYTVHIAEASGGCELRVGVGGETQRHKAIPFVIRGYLASAGLSATERERL